MKTSMMRGLLIWLLLLFSALYCGVTNEETVQEAKKNKVTVDVNIGVIYDEDSLVGKMGFKCIQMALSDFYNSHGHHKTRIVLHTRLFPKNSVVGAAAAGENVLSNLTRFVVIIWVFVVLVLTQSYTASLTSMLTVQKLQPTITDVDELKRNGASVGFQEGSFVKELLHKRGFNEAKLVPYNTTEELDELMLKGSTNGGIAAVFDEIPYMKLFLAKYSSKYMMVQLTYKTDGFGFAFPKGSPLAPEVSRGILNVTEGEEMVTMEKKWGLQLGNDNSDEVNTVTSGSLGLDSFWGLFLIAGVASGFALLIFTATFLSEQWQVWRDTDASTWSKIRRLAKAFEQRDVGFHTFRKHEVQSRRNVEDDLANVDGFDEVGITQDGSPLRP